MNWQELTGQKTFTLPDKLAFPKKRIRGTKNASKNSAAAAAAKSLQSCPTLCDPIDGRPPGCPIPAILQARILEWVAISFSNAWKWKVKVQPLSHVRLLATPWTAAYQAPPSLGFSRQEYWSGVPLPSPKEQCSEQQVSTCVCIHSSQFQFMYWAGQEVCSGFSVRCYQKTRKEPFGQPNGLVGLTHPTLWLYRWASGPVLANGQKFDLPSPDHRDEFRNQNKSLVYQPQPVLPLYWGKAFFPWVGVAKPEGCKSGWRGAISATAEEEASNKANAEKVKLAMEKQSRRGTQL